MLKDWTACPPASLHHIILGAHQNHAFRARIVGPADVHAIRAGHILGIRRLVAAQQTHERSPGICFFQQAADGIGIRPLLHSGRNGGANAGIHGDQMGGEGHHHSFPGSPGKLLFNLAQMAVLRHAVGMEAFVAFAEQQGNARLAPRAAYAAAGTHHHVFRFQNPGLEQRDERQRMLVG